VAFEDSISGITSAEAAGTIAIGVPNFIPIPEKEGRILWATLEGVNYKTLRKFVK
jgi:beta-phosphoglucomutase-like phosphatase (HAD superfamily)